MSRSISRRRFLGSAAVAAGGVTVGAVGFGPGVASAFEATSTNDSAERRRRRRRERKEEVDDCVVAAPTVKADDAATAAPASVQPPEILGEPVVGNTLTASTGSWV